jgi:hypothetical protein
MRILLLAYYHPRYMKPLMYWGGVFRSIGWSVKEMYPDAFYKEEVLDELANDYDLIVYFGHGIPGVWNGFGFITSGDIACVPNNKSRIVISLSCYSLCGRKSIGDAFLSGSSASSVIGYDDRIKYEENIKVLDGLFSAIAESGISGAVLENAVIGTGNVHLKFVSNSPEIKSPISSTGASG